MAVCLGALLGGEDSQGLLRVLQSIAQYIGWLPPTGPTWYLTPGTSLLFAEAYLASLRDPRLSQELAVVLVEFRRRFAEWLAAHGQADPVPTAAVLAAALDGVLLHRALGPDLTSSVVRQILGRLLVYAVRPPALRSPRTRNGTHRQ